MVKRKRMIYNRVCIGGRDVLIHFELRSECTDFAATLEGERYLSVGKTLHVKSKFDYCLLTLPRSCNKMKSTMADDSEEFNLFSVGTLVSCKTCFGEEFEGEVIAFDYQTKILFIKCMSKSGKANLHDMRMINLDFVEDVVIKKEVATPVNGTQSLLPLNIEKLSGRAKQHVKERQRLVNALTSGVSSEGVKLYLAITKTISEVTWQGKNIVVMNQVTITPPYRPENCKTVGKGDGDAVNHVRRIVEKYFKDQAQAQPSQSPQTQSRPHLQ